jgi:hypothetical protein
MSGPKVVRIVTREEILAICNGHLARLGAAIRCYEDWCRANGLASENEMRLVRERQAAIVALLGEEKFLELQKRAPELIQWLETDRDLRSKKAAERAVAVRHGLDRARKIASDVLRKERNLPAILSAQVKDVESGRVGDLEKANAILAEAFAKSSHAPETGRADIGGAAAAYEDGASSQRIEDWIARQPPINDDEQEMGVLLSELAVEESEEFVRPYREQWASLSAYTGGGFGLRRQSLAVQARAALKEARDRRTLAEELVVLSAEWSSLTNSPAPWPDVVATSTNLAEIAKQARASVSEEYRRKQAEARRRAVLNTLATLGYEVREGLMTALAENGSVVLRKSANPDYGVEVVSPEKGDRLAFRTVAFGDVLSPRNKTRDTDAESTWCSDLEHLKKRVFAEAGHIVIERAVPVGAEPVKVVGAENSSRQAAPEIGQSNRKVRPIR